MIGFNGIDKMLQYLLLVIDSDDSIEALLGSTAKVSLSYCEVDFWLIKSGEKM